MTVPSLPSPPLAQYLWERFSQGLADEFRNRRLTVTDVLLGVAILLGVAAVAWACSRLLRMRDRYRVFRSPARLFFVLCRAHRLRWRECWWLWRLARFQRLRDPARLFLEAERFDPAQLSPSLRARGHELMQLRGRLFAETALKTGQAVETGGAHRRGSAKKTASRAASVPLSSLSASAAGPKSDERVAGTPLLPATANPALDLPPWNAANGPPLDV
jgi:hypothetical protein